MGEPLKDWKCHLHSKISVTVSVSTLSDFCQHLQAITFYGGNRFSKPSVRLHVGAQAMFVCTSGPLHPPKLMLDGRGPAPWRSRWPIKEQQEVPVITLRRFFPLYFYHTHQQIRRLNELVSAAVTLHQGRQLYNTHTLTLGSCDPLQANGRCM